MIHKITLFGKEYFVPGWANVIILFPVYFALAIVIDFIVMFLFTTYTEMHFALDFAFAFGYVTFYLAKWRFYQRADGTWEHRFN